MRCEQPQMVQPRFSYGEWREDGRQRAHRGATDSYRSAPRVRIKNMANARSLVVRIKDREPFVVGRIIDLSQAVLLAYRVPEISAPFPIRKG